MPLLKGSWSIWVVLLGSPRDGREQADDETWQQKFAAQGPSTKIVNTGLLYKEFFLYCWAKHFWGWFFSAQANCFSFSFVCVCVYEV